MKKAKTSRTSKRRVAAKRKPAGKKPVRKNSRTKKIEMRPIPLPEEITKPPQRK
jgi:hypothetical protein